MHMTAIAGDMRCDGEEVSKRSSSARAGDGGYHHLIVFRLYNYMPGYMNFLLAVPRYCGLGLAPAEMPTSTLGHSNQGTSVCFGSATDWRSPTPVAWAGGDDVPSQGERSRARA